MNPQGSFQNSQPGPQQPNAWYSAPNNGAPTNFASSSQPQAMVANNTFAPNQSWYPDSGASFQVTRILKIFNNQFPLKALIKFTWATVKVCQYILQVPQSFILLLILLFL